MSTWRHRLGLLLWCAAALTCGSHDPGGQSVTLLVRYPAHLSLDHLTLAAELPMDPARQVRATAPNPPRALDPAGETLGLTVPDALSAGVMAVMVEGWAGDVLAARQQMMLAVPLTAQMVTIELEAVVTGCEGPTCGPSCGDGAVHPGEACDDGGQQAGDGCSPACTIEEGWRCQGAPSTCTEECPDGCEACGDGIVQASETCDDGDREAGDGCNANCSVETGWSCEDEPSVCAELCPGGCPVCGDGLVHDLEGCDDGAREAGDGCDSSCQLEAGWVCEGEPSACTEECADGCPGCGDGVIQDSESCDDGAREAGDGCNPSCQLEEGWDCAGEPSNCDTNCKDGLIRGDEACDDGNNNNHDGCRNSCSIESGYMCVGEPSSCSPICGDGQIMAGEACDDDNSAPGDGCDDQCQVEAGYSCAGEPSVCTANEPTDAGVPEDAGPTDTGVHPDAEPADAGAAPDA